MDKDLISPKKVEHLILKDDCSISGGDVDNSVKSSSSPSSSTSIKSFEDEEFLTSCDNLLQKQSQIVDYTFNIIMIGDSGVGKTDLIGRLCDDDFTTKFFATIGINMESCCLNFGGNGKRAKLQIWDPSGSDRFRYVVTKYIHNAHGIVFVYDVTYAKSFENIKEWIISVNNNPEVGSKVAKILIGNKCDMNRRMVDKSEGETLAESHGIKFIETSTRTGLNVKQAFTILCEEMKEFQGSQSLPPSSGSLPKNSSISSPTA